MLITYFVYILTNKHNTVLYTGVANDLDRRLEEHRTTNEKSFTSKFKVTKLVYYKTMENIRSAINRKKQIKGGSRQNKIDLINLMNSEWLDLSQMD